MGEFLPDYLIREQAAVGALVVFLVLRVIASIVAHERGWRIGFVDQCFVGAVALYCLPQIFDVLTHLYGARVAAAELEGKIVGGALALFSAPIVGHKLGFE